MDIKYVFYLPYLGYSMFHLSAFVSSVFVTRLMVLDAYQHIYNRIILHNGVYIYELITHAMTKRTPIFILKNVLILLFVLRVRKIFCTTSLISVFNKKKTIPTSRDIF